MDNQKKQFLLYFMLSALCLSAGVLIYLCAGGRQTMGIFRILRNYGADFLWLWSYAFALAPFLRGLFPKKYLGVLFGVCTGTGILFEGLQGLEVFRGTADFWDVAVYFTAAVSGCLIIKQISKRGAVK